MGWEKRNGKLYYYYKERHGDLILSSYCGSSDYAEMMAHATEVKKEALALLRERRRLEFEQEQLRDAMVAQVVDNVGRLVAAALEANGYHEHKGEWRKRRHGIDAGSNDGRLEKGVEHAP